MKNKKCILTLIVLIAFVGFIDWNISEHRNIEKEILNKQFFLSEPESAIYDIELLQVHHIKITKNCNKQVVHSNRGNLKSLEIYISYSYASLSHPPDLYEIQRMNI